MTFGAVQITSRFKQNNKRFMNLMDKIIPKMIEIFGDKYVLVSPPNSGLQEHVSSLGGKFIEFNAWDKDKNRKFREGIKLVSEKWMFFLDDDILPDEDWYSNATSWLQDKQPGQYGFRLTNQNGVRHQFGEDWMQFMSPKYNLRHRPLDYDFKTGYIEQSPTSYVANSVVHKEVYQFVEPFGVFQRAPDVSWSFAIKEAGFPIGFCLNARAFHIGDRGDNR